MPRFTYTENGARKSVELTGDLLVVGSDAACGLVIADAAVSPVHCEFRRGANGWRVVDLESREGTSVNGEFVNQRVLSEGDVVQIGAVRGAVTDLAAAGTPAARAGARPAAAAPTTARAAPPPAPRAMPAGGVSRGAPSRGRAEPGDDGGERRPRRRNASGTPILVIAGVCVGILILGYVALPNKDMGANYDLRTKAGDAFRRSDWQEVVRLASQADPAADAPNYKYIDDMRKQAEVALRGAQSAGESAAAHAAWNTILQWWQANDFKDKDEYGRRLDEYLTKYGHLASVGPTEARKQRVQYFGSASPGGVIPASEAGFAAIKTDVELLSAAGRFADAAAALDGWWQKAGSSAPGVSTQVEALRAETVKTASKWIDGQIVLARMQKDRGENRKAQNTLLNAAERVGIPELAQRARDEINKL